MSEITNLPTATVLGLPFFNGTVEEAVEHTLDGALVMAPSGPGLAAIDREPVYYQAVKEADVILVDSGFLAILWERQSGQKLSRISGLRFLKALLDAPGLPPAREQLWVMPTPDEAAANQKYLKERGFELPTENVFLAPRYPDSGDIRDEILLKRIQAQRPRLIVLNIAGGKQEVLGAWLKRSLDYRPGIICTGAAIAFLTGRQAPIPEWVDLAKLGWLQRILFSPKRYLPRYLAARRLAALVRKYGEHGPGLEVYPTNADNPKAES